MPVFRPQALPRFSRLSWLMGLYGENYQRMARLFDLGSLEQGRYLSRCVNGLDLVVEVLEVHPYTLELRLSYRVFRRSLDGTREEGQRNILTPAASRSGF